MGSADGSGKRRLLPRDFLALPSWGDFKVHEDSLPRIYTDFHEFLNQSVRIRETCAEPVEVSVAEVFGFSARNGKTNKKSHVVAWLSIYYLPSSMSFTP